MNVRRNTMAQNTDTYEERERRPNQNEHHSMPRGTNKEVNSVENITSSQAQTPNLDDEVTRKIANLRNQVEQPGVRKSAVDRDEEVMRVEEMERTIMQMQQTQEVERRKGEQTLKEIVEKQREEMTRRIESEREMQRQLSFLVKQIGILMNGNRPINPNHLIPNIHQGMNPGQMHMNQIQLC